jgi:hypothetical protein
MTEKYFVFSGKFGSEVRYVKDDKPAVTVSCWLYHEQAEKEAAELNAAIAFKNRDEKL